LTAVQVAGPRAGHAPSKQVARDRGHPGSRGADPACRAPKDGPSYPAAAHTGPTVETACNPPRCCAGWDAGWDNAADGCRTRRQLLEARYHAL